MGSEGILCGFDIAIIYDILGARYCGNLIQSQILKPSFFLQSNNEIKLLQRISLSDLIWHKKIAKSKEFLIIFFDYNILKRFE